MKRELKKTIVFGIIITFFTSTYAAFLSTVMRQDFSSERFFSNWIGTIPKTYLLLLPFVLIMGRLTKLLVDRIFGNENLNKK